MLDGDLLEYAFAGFLVAVLCLVFHPSALVAVTAIILVWQVYLRLKLDK